MLLKQLTHATFIGAIDEIHKPMTTQGHAARVGAVAGFAVHNNWIGNND